MKWIITFSIFLYLYFSLHTNIQKQQREINDLKIKVSFLETNKKPKTEIDYIWDAFCEVESKNNIYAVGKTQDCGIAQLRPIYVAEVNRICGSNVFTLSDRFNPEKAKQMFCIMQTSKNPKYDLDRAIKLHNPKGEKPYSNEIKKEYYKLKNK